MMDLFLADRDEVPLPAEDVRIQEFRVEPWPDGRRVRVTLVVDPFQKRPSVEVVIRNAADEAVAEVAVIESITRKIELNMHLRMPDTAGTYCAQAVLFFQSIPAVNDGEPVPSEPTERLQVDYKESYFEITS